MNAMRTVAVRNLAAHKVRLALTVVSVLLGTAFVAGSFVFTDTLKQSFDKIFQTSDRGIDTQVNARHDGDPGVPTSLLARIAAVPGAATVEPTIESSVVLVDPHGNKIESNGAPSVGGMWSTRSVNPVPTFVSGHAPRTATELVLNEGAARQHHLHTGDHVKVVVSSSTVVAATISGVYRVDYDTGGYVGALFTPAQALRLFTDGSHYTAVNVAAAPGVPEHLLTQRIAALLPDYLQARTGTAVRAADSQDVADALSFVNYILLGFGIIALLVGTFIIYNTFTMIVAQRQRELALLRAIGADRRQVRRSVVLEAAVIGLVGSALGLAGGLGLAAGLHALLNSLDLGLPSGGLVVGARTAIVTIVLGTAVTLLAAYTPARRASTIAPVAAMRAEHATPSAAGLRRRTVVGAAVAAGATVATVAGAVAGSAGASATLTGLGLVAVCAAAMLLAPLFARWVVVPLGRVVGAPFGTVGRLATTNAVRNPRRTAATAFALTVGMVLVAGIAVLGSSVKASLAGIVDNTVRADFIVTTDSDIGVPQPAAAAVAAVPGVASTTRLHDLSVAVGGVRQRGTAVDGPLAGVVAVPLQHGAAALTGHRILVSEDTATRRGWHLGEHLTFGSPGRPDVRVQVGGIYAKNQLLGPFLAGNDVYRALTPPQRRDAFVVLVHTRPGADRSAVRAQIERVTNDYYVVKVLTTSGFKGEVAGQIDGLVGLLYGLLGLALVIAVLGIVNTLALSVVERRREIGMLRAVGMQRPQVRRTITLESLLIAVFGAVLGLVIGLGFGALFTRALHAAGLDRLSVPWGQSVLFLGLAAAVGVLAALWPAVRAARTRPLAAITAA